MKKLFGIVAVFILLLSGVVLAATTGHMKAEYTGKNVRIRGNIYDLSQYENVSAYCSHNNTTYYIGSEILNDNNKKFLTSEIFNVRSRNTSCKKGDFAWVTAKNFTSSQIKIVGHHRHQETRVQIVPKYESDFSNCKADALAWYDEHTNQRFAWQLYQTKLFVCKFKYDKAVCELDESKEWIFGMCNNKVKHNCGEDKLQVRSCGS